MKERKYRQYYRIVDAGSGKTGHPRQEVQYTGCWYRFPAGTPGPARRARRLAVPLGIYWAAALAYLTGASATSRDMGTLLPFLIGLFPGAYALMGLVTFARAPSPMTVYARDTGIGRVVPSGLGLGVCSALATIEAVYCLGHTGRLSEAWVEPLLTFTCAAAGFVAFACARLDFKALESVGSNQTKPNIIDN